MAGRLIGKRIFVTGAAQGIGLAIAQAFAREEAALFLVDMAGELLAQEAEALREAGACRDRPDQRAGQQCRHQRVLQAAGDG